jgi:hypothetical protein
VKYRETTNPFINVERGRKGREIEKGECIRQLSKETGVPINSNNPQVAGTWLKKHAAI